MPRHSQQPTTTSPKPEKRKINIIEWLLDLGVGAPEGPTTPKDDAFKSLSSQSCDPINPDFAVLEAAATACRAARGSDNTTDWDHARHIRDTTDRSSLDCKDKMAFALLDALVQAHLDYPDLPFRFNTGDGLVRQQCLTVTSVEPREAYNGDLVTVRGHNLSLADRVGLFVTHGPSPATATVVRRSESLLRIRIPDHPERVGHSIVIAWNDNDKATATWARLQFGPRPQTARSTPSAGTGVTPPGESGPTPSGGTGPRGELSPSQPGGDVGQTTPGAGGDQ